MNLAHVGFVLLTCYNHPANPAPHNVPDIIKKCDLVRSYDLAAACEKERDRRQALEPPRTAFHLQDDGFWARDKGVKADPYTWWCLPGSALR